MLSFCLTVSRASWISDTVVLMTRTNSTAVVGSACWCPLPAREAQMSPTALVQYPFAPRHHSEAVCRRSRALIVRSWAVGGCSSILMLPSGLSRSSCRSQSPWRPMERFLRPPRLPRTQAWRKVAVHRCRIMCWTRNRASLRNELTSASPCLSSHPASA